MLTDTTALDHDFGITNCPPHVELAAEKLMLICGFDYFQCKSHVPPSYVSFLVSPYQASNFVKKLIRTRKQGEGQKRAAAPSLSPSTEYQSLNRPTVWFLGTQKGEAEGFDFKFLDCLSRAKICCHHASGANVVFGSKLKSERTII